MSRTKSSRASSGPIPIERGGALPLWQQVHNDLVRRAGAGEFADVFPGELALVEEYGVSRHTVREALRRLRAAGIVRGERGRTSRLTDPAEINQSAGTLYSVFAAVEAAGQEQRSEVRRLDVRVDGVVAERLDIEASTPLVYLERRRLAGGRPLALDRVWIPADIAEPLLEADFTKTALYVELERRCGLRPTGGQETVRAVIPTQGERRSLDMPTGTAALAIERIARVGARAVEWRHMLIRGDRFAVSTQFSGQGLQLIGSAGSGDGQDAARRRSRV